MVLEAIKEILEKEAFNCTLVAPTKKILTHQLSIALGVDSKKRERQLTVVATEQQLSPEFIPPPSASQPYRFQFYVELPFTVENMALGQVASLLLFLNQSIHLPGFELNESTGQVLYRYVWIIHPYAIDSTLIMSIVGAIMLNIGMFSDTIESLANRRISFHDLLTQLAKSRA